MTAHMPCGFVLMCALFSLVSTELVWTETKARPPATPERIAEELRLIESAGSWHATNDELGRVWSLLASDYRDVGETKRAEDAYDHALKLLQGTSTSLVSYAATLDGLGSLYAGTNRMREAENCRRKAIEVFERLGDTKSAAIIQGNLALDLVAEGKHKDGEREASTALEQMQGEKDADKSVMILPLLTRTYARCVAHRCKEGLADARLAMELVRRSAGPDGLEVVAAWMALGYALWKTGDDSGGGDAMREGLRILNERRDLPHPMLNQARVGVLTQYSVYLKGTRHKEEAKRVENDISALQSASERTCNGCTVSLFGLSSALR